MPGPAARVGDAHTCPLTTGVVPHVGGPVVGPGVTTVLVGGLPAATVGDLCVCTGPPDTIVTGSATVLIAERPAARLGSGTAHGGAVVGGHATVLVGG
ncbi:MAG TPA: PAAR domain-containing protein [Gaiellaceae bacterium]|nr:PAAR domain-containing protein [Gaiellaceae bacterium]